MASETDGALGRGLCGGVLQGIKASYMHGAESWCGGHDLAGCAEFAGAAAMRSRDTAGVCAYPDGRRAAPRASPRHAGGRIREQPVGLRQAPRYTLAMVGGERVVRHALLGVHHRLLPRVTRERRRGDPLQALTRLACDTRARQHDVGDTGVRERPVVKKPRLGLQGGRLPNARRITLRPSHSYYCQGWHGFRVRIRVVCRFARCCRLAPRYAGAGGVDRGQSTLPGHTSIAPSRERRSSAPSSGSGATIRPCIELAQTPTPNPTCVVVGGSFSLFICSFGRIR